MEPFYWHTGSHHVIPTPRYDPGYSTLTLYQHIFTFTGSFLSEYKLYVISPFLKKKKQQQILTLGILSLCPLNCCLIFFFLSPFAGKLFECVASTCFLQFLSSPFLNLLQIGFCYHLSTCIVLIKVISSFCVIIINGQFSVFIWSATIDKLADHSLILSPSYALFIWLPGYLIHSWFSSYLIICSFSVSFAGFSSFPWLRVPRVQCLIFFSSWYTLTFFFWWYHSASWP